MNPPDKFPAVLAAAAMGVYLLVVVGATTSLTEAAAACGGWPACGDGTALPVETGGWIALGHRLLAVVVGLCIALSAALAWRDDVSRRIRAALAVALAVYPVQAGVGALVAVGRLPAALSPVHLLLGVAIFAAVLAALAWWLEAETGDPDDAPAEFEPGTDALPPVGETPEPEIPTATLPRLRATAAAYFRLMKPRLMWLLCLVASAAMALAAGPDALDVETVVLTLTGGVLSIGAAGTFNHVLERDVDRRMARTNDRPLATDLVPVPNAVAFGLLLTGPVVVNQWIVILRQIECDFAGPLGPEQGTENAGSLVPGLRRLRQVGQRDNGELAVEVNRPCALLALHHRAAGKQRQSQ